MVVVVVVGEWLLGLVFVITLLAMAVGMPPDRFIGPDWLRNSIGGRLVLVVAGLSGVMAIDVIGPALWHILSRLL
jgi:hypothetical protein